RPPAQLLDELLQRRPLGRHAVEVQDKRPAVAVRQALVQQPHLDVEPESGAEAGGKVLVHLVIRQQANETVHVHGEVPLVNSGCGKLRTGAQRHGEIPAGLLCDQTSVAGSRRPWASGCGRLERSPETLLSGVSGSAAILDRAPIEPTHPKATTR